MRPLWTRSRKFNYLNIRCRSPGGFDWVNVSVSYSGCLSSYYRLSFFSHSTHHISFFISDCLIGYFNPIFCIKCFPWGLLTQMKIKYLGYWDSSLNILVALSNINPVWIATTLNSLKNLFRPKGIFSPNLRILTLKNNEPTLYNSILCNACDHEFIGQIKRQVGTRFKSHLATKQL